MATLDALSRGDTPPPAELEVARTPRSGVGITHRVAVLLRGTNGWLGRDRLAARGARARARRLGGAAAARPGATSAARSTCSTQRTQPLEPTEVRLSDLGISRARLRLRRRARGDRRGLRDRAAGGLRGADLQRRRRPRRVRYDERGKAEPQLPVGVVAGVRAARPARLRPATRAGRPRAARASAAVAVDPKELVAAARARSSRPTMRRRRSRTRCDRAAKAGRRSTSQLLRRHGDRHRRRRCRWPCSATSASPRAALADRRLASASAAVSRTRAAGLAARAGAGGDWADVAEAGRERAGGRDPADAALRARPTGPALDAAIAARLR